MDGWMGGRMDRGRKCEKEKRREEWINEEC
jgi:hypothetical protein